MSIRAFATVLRVTFIDKPGVKPFIVVRIVGDNAQHGEFHYQLSSPSQSISSPEFIAWIKERAAEKFAIEFQPDDTVRLFYHSDITQ